MCTKNRASSLSSLNGKILRLNPSGDAPQFDLLADPDATDAATTLLDAAASRLDSQPVWQVAGRHHGDAVDCQRAQGDWAS